MPSTWADKRAECARHLRPAHVSVSWHRRSTPPGLSGGVRAARAGCMPCSMDATGRVRLTSSSIERCASAGRSMANLSRQHARSPSPTCPSPSASSRAKAADHSLRICGRRQARTQVLSTPADLGARARLARGQRRAVAGGSAAARQLYSAARRWPSPRRRFVQPVFAVLVRSAVPLGLRVPRPSMRARPPSMRARRGC